MPVYFANKGTLDLDVIRVMGVSIKTNDNPIGFFGTGLKFAISTLLRTGHKIKLTTGGKEYILTCADVVIREKEFQRVKMNDELLPFTTELGKTWEVWQAYRELHSNTLDEEGTISDRAPDMFDTLIEVTGSGIEQAYYERHTIFIGDRTPIVKTDDLEVYEGESNAVFYRGVRAGHLPGKTAYTYNILSHQTLSEDRVLKSLYDAEWAIQKDLPAMPCRSVADRVINSQDHFEAKLSFEYCGKPSGEFLDAVAEAAPDIRINGSARKVLERHRQNEGQFQELKPLSDEYADIFASSLVLARHMGAVIEDSEITLVVTLGPSVFGMYHRKTGRIYVATAALDRGVDFVAATIFEEWMHKHQKIADYSREFQDFVLQRLVQMTKQFIERSEGR